MLQSPVLKCVYYSIFKIIYIIIQVPNRKENNTCISEGISPIQYSDSATESIFSLTVERKQK